MSIGSPQQNKPDRVTMIGLDFGSTTSSAMVATAGVEMNSTTGRMGFGTPNVVYRSDPVFTTFNDTIIDQARLNIYLDQWITESRLNFAGAFAGLFFKTLLGDDCPIIGEANNLPYDTRLTGPARVTMYGFNAINIAFMPADKGKDLFEEVRALHPFVKLYADVLEAGLSIVNRAFHAGLCLFSINDHEGPGS